MEIIGSARLVSNYGNSNSRFPLLSACPVLPQTRGIYGSFMLGFYYRFRSKTCEFYVSQRVGQTSRDTAHPSQDGEEGIKALKKRHIFGNVSVVREVIDSLESR